MSAAIRDPASLDTAPGRQDLWSPAWADDDWYKPNATAAPPRQPKPGEHVWTLVKAGRRFDCDLRFQVESYGWECQVLEDGEIRDGQPFLSRVGADAEA